MSIASVSKKKKTTNKSKDLKQVQDHYLDYPYPLRNPEDDKTKLMMVYGDYLGEISHWLFEGKEDFKKGFRILIAGGETGDSTVYLADQLQNIDNAEIVYLDFSKNSMEIAQKRAENRGIKDKITWINDSIFNIPDLKLGKFDYIQTSGVLHHLESPDAGLKILSDSLTEKGGINIMVYAQYGRTAVYQIQELMRMVNEGVSSREEEVKNAWSVINSLPESNWQNRGKDLIQDHVHFGDIGMYDLFLHKQDRAYTVPQIYDFVEKAGLNFIDFNSAHSRVMLKPEHYIKDSEMLKKLHSLDKRKQQAICEIMTGDIIKHSFFASKNKDPKAKLTNLDNVPYTYTMPNLPKQISDYIEENPALINGTVNFSFKTDFFKNDVSLTLPVSTYTGPMFKYISEGGKSFREIFDLISKDLGQKITDAQIAEEINKIFPVMEEVGVLLLKHKKADIANMGEDPIAS